MPYTLELVEPGIMRVTWTGAMGRENFTQGIYDRIHFANEHGLDRYVLIFDVRDAAVSVIDVRLSRWATEADPRLIHVLMLGRPLIIQVIVGMLASLTRQNIEFVDSLEAGVQRARQILQQPV